MSRLIDADALIAELNGIRYPGAPYVDAGIRIAVGKVCDAPTIEERKTGKWIKKSKRLDFCTEWWYECSECGSKPPRHPSYLTDFCPNCGADMRGEQP